MELSQNMVLIIFVLLWILLLILDKFKEKHDLKLNYELKTYFVFGVLKTKIGLKFIDKVGKYKFWRWLSTLSIPLAIFISIFAFVNYMMSSLGIINGSIEREAATPVIMLFGNTIPWIAGIFALGIGITVHELAHGIVARSFNQKIKSTGLLLALGIPLGAFVELSEEYQNSAKRVRGSVAAAGPMANLVLAILFLFALPWSASLNSDITISEVLEGHPADGILKSNDIIYSIDGNRIESLQEFQKEASELKPNVSSNIIIIRDDKKLEYNITAGSDGKIGIMAITSGYVNLLVNTIYWSFMLNLLLAIFNLLPAIPLDGYHIWISLPDTIRELGNSRITDHIANGLAYIINDKVLHSIGSLIWLLIFVVIIYSFI
ncbi:site-2 protease family protein [Methanococcus voltae]|uniref:Peptidase M50 n=1 Tax=Methanococcus voltae (strain ATCC BAA-1334 / A3) TaxID=456320 RepID=D7DQI4_METV3|nr:site-2 protease family protein [Methanococcus voltae]MCS3901654.1 Zn-dependent protease [Methanococcus voltae]